MNNVIGIDLGTGNSCVSVIENGKPVVVANAEGGRTTPSIVSFKDASTPVVGDAARRQRVVYPKQTVYNVKRFMGESYNECSKVISKVPYEVTNVNGQPRISIDGREYSPEEISAHILTKMKKTAEDYLGCEVKDAVITCPAWFSTDARNATKNAGTIAGLNVLRIINEPTAAILASNISTNDKKTKKVMVCDVGCGTTDFSVADISEGVVEILASKGDVFLGGSDWDNAITDYLIDNFKNEYGIDLTKDTQAYSRIIEAAEKAKIELSTIPSTEINLPYITVKDNKPLHMVVTLTRAKMEQLTSSLVERVTQCAREALEAAKLSPSDLDCILMVGGQSRSLAIQQSLTNAFGVELNKSVNPDEAVAQGAAIQANIIVGGNGAGDILLLDVTPLTLGLETMGGVMTPIVEANTTIPCSKTQIFTTAEDNQTAVTLNVLQGERPMAKDNKQIGLFNLDGIAPAARGIPQIEVSFDIDVNGIVTVKATDKATGKEQHITIQNSGSLSKEEIERIKNEAKEHEAEDKKAREMSEKMNKCESLIYHTEQTMNSFKDNPSFTENDKEFFNAKIAQLNDMKAHSDFSQLDSVEQEMTQRWQSISSKAYSAQNTSNPSGENNSGNGANNTDDAEVQDAK